MLDKFLCVANGIRIPSTQAENYANSYYVLRMTTIKWIKNAVSAVESEVSRR